MKEGNSLSRWCSIYSTWASSAIAGPTVLSKPLTTATVVTGDFFDSLDASFRSMWMSAVWVGPGVTAITTVIPPLQPFLRSLSASLISSYDPELAPTLISTALHTYTLGITVTITPITGTPFIVPLI